MQEHAKKAIEDLKTNLRAYANSRDPINLVGQFLDSNGISNKQHGIYGMSSWIVLTEGENICDVENIKKIRIGCKQKLREWINESHTKTIAQLEADKDSSAYEIRFVISKICFAFEALSKFEDCNAEVQILKNYIVQYQNHSEGWWGYMYNSSGGNPITTCSVVRAFGAQDDFSSHLTRALVYLRNSWEHISNVYEKLYVLNTIYLHVTTDSSIRSQMHSQIKATLKTLYLQMLSNPTKFPNPINIDFNDGSRTRYLRLSADLILLESLNILSNKHLHYFYAHTGRRVFLHLINNLSNQPFNRDTTGHRASAGFYLLVYKFLMAILKKEESKQYKWLRRFIGWFKSSFSFGPNFNISFLIFITAIAGLIASIFLNQPYGITISSAILGRAVVDIITTISNLYRARGY